MTNPEDNLSRTPPLASLTAAAAVCSLLINRLLIPSLGKESEYELVFDLIRAGHFAANLTAVAGLFAILTVIFNLVRTPEQASVRRRLAIACFAGIFIPTIALATFFPREKTSVHIVLLGIGAANVLIVIITMNAARLTKSSLARAVAVGFATMALFTLASQVYHLLTIHQLNAIHVKIVNVLKTVGEIGYVVALLSAAFFIFPRGTDLREQFARIATVVVFGASVFGFHIVQSALGSDFILLLYHAQRVSGLIDTLPFAYAFPISIGFAASIGALVAKDKSRFQAAIGVILLISAGFAPYSPERLLTQTLAAVLIARSIIALAKQSVLSEAAA
jgi:hypothetical protein